MICVSRPALHTLPKLVRDDLSREHAAARQFLAGDIRIKPRWTNFRRRNSGLQVLAALRTALRTKCVFCERVNAKTIDHYYPKERYPKRMFRWTNLLLCCSDCNRAKGELFEFRERVPLFIDPTQDDPADFYEWDVSTGAMLLVADPSRSERAKYTRDQLELDEQPLQDKRREKVEIVRALLILVNLESVVRPETRGILGELLGGSSEYLGILRFWFRNLSADDRRLFDTARAKLPEIDTWLAPWL